MEHASSSSGMSFPKDLRPKQKEIIEAFEVKNRVVAKLPTGYGKTKAAAGAFAQTYHLSKCNRMLVIVPRRGQADQAAEEIPSTLAEFGLQTKAWIVGDDPIRSIRASKTNSCLAFVVTIQSLLSQKTWGAVGELMDTCSWFVFADEYHHYRIGEDDTGEWTEAIKSLKYTAILAASATPRLDRADFFGDPDISETYVNAADLGYVKKLSCHAYHYTIDAVTVDGTVIRLTTEELAGEAGSDSPEAIEKYLTSRKMRFSPKYVSPLVTFPVGRLIDLRSRSIRAQMMIQAMSCSHAQCVVDQIKMLVPEHMRVDWVGTGPNGRKPEDNARILKEWCPKKNPITGRRPWSLDILINVGMAGEGMDSIDVTEISFLTPANKTNSNYQIIGRGSRPMKECDQICHINVDTGSKMAGHIGREIEKIFDDPTADEPSDDETNKKEPSEPPDYEELPDKLSWMIADVRLDHIRSEPMFQAIYEKTRERTDLARTDEEVAAAAERAVLEYMNRGGNNQSAIIAQKTDQINSAASKIAGLVIRRLGESGMRIERTLAGDLRKRINTQKKRDLGSVINADDDMLDRHWEWLKSLERRILLEHGLQGLPQWLR